MSLCVWVLSDLLLGRPGATSYSAAPRKRLRSGQRARTANVDATPDTRLEAHGMVVISPGQEFVGELTPWPRAAWLWHDHLSEPLDAYTVIVQHFFRFDVPVPVDAALSETGHIAESPNSFRAIMIPCLPPAVWGQEGCTAEARKSLRMALDEWGFDNDAQRGQLFGIRLDSIARQKVLSGEWPWIMLLARWRKAIFQPPWPPLQWMRTTAGKNAAFDGVPVLASQSLLGDLVSNIRFWVGSLAALWQTSGD